MMPPQSFCTTTTANEGEKKCCNFDLLKNEYKQNVIEQQTRSSKFDSCMHTNHNNHANNNDHKGSENENENGTGSREAREGQVSKSRVWAGSFDGQQLEVRCAPV
jgi:hypothetical protein